LKKLKVIDSKLVKTMAPVKEMAEWWAETGQKDTEWFGIVQPAPPPSPAGRVFNCGLRGFDGI